MTNFQLSFKTDEDFGSEIARRKKKKAPHYSGYLYKAEDGEISLFG